MTQDSEEPSAPRKRIEVRGKRLRVSRTGGAAVRVQKKLGDVTVTANSKHGLRLSTRLGKGLRFAVQNGRTQLIGRWQRGPVAFNLSKSGVSASVGNERGRVNVLKPRYSSFKVAGLSFRGKRAVQLHLLYGVFQLILVIVPLLFRLVAGAFWLVVVLLALPFDVAAGAVKGLSDSAPTPDDGSPSEDEPESR